MAEIASLEKTKLEILAAEAERKKAAELVRKQEAEEYNYKLSQQRAHDVYEMQRDHLIREREFLDKLAVIEKDLADRRTDLVKQEAAYKDAMEKIAGMPAVIEAAKKEAVAAAVGAVHSEHKHAIAILQAESRNEVNLLKATNAALQKQVETQEAAIAALQVSLNNAQNRVESIAKSALDSASGRQALEAASCMAGTLRDSSNKK